MTNLSAHRARWVVAFAAQVINNIFKYILLTKTNLMTQTIRVNVASKMLLGWVVGEIEGSVVGIVVGAVDGWVEGQVVGPVVGHVVGPAVGSTEGKNEGPVVGHVVGAVVGVVVGIVVGVVVGCVVGAFVGGKSHNISTIIISNSEIVTPCIKNFMLQHTLMSGHFDIVPSSYGQA